MRPLSMRRGWWEQARFEVAGAGDRFTEMLVRCCLSVTDLRTIRPSQYP